jgi:hypothetical protein
MADINKVTIVNLGNDLLRLQRMLIYLRKNAHFMTFASPSVARINY